MIVKKNYFSRVFEISQLTSASILDCRYFSIKKMSYQKSASHSVDAFNYSVTASIGEKDRNRFEI